MPINDCVGKLKGIGRTISDEQVAKMNAEADRLENLYRATGKYAEAEVRARAELDAVQSLLEDASNRQQVAARRAIVTKKLTKVLGNHKAGSKAALREMLVSLDGAVDGLSVENMASGIYSRATLQLGEFAERFRSKLPGGFDTHFRANQSAIRDVARAMFNDTRVGSQAQQFAKAFKAATDSLLDELELAGVKVARLKDYGMAIKWDFYKLSKVSAQDYAKTIRPLVDDAKMIAADGRVMTSDEIMDVLVKSHGEILDRERSGAGSSMLGGTANELGERHRVIHFKSGDDYLKAYDLFGSGELYDDMMNRLENLATDAAIAHKFGPQPDQVFKTLNNKVQNDLAANPNKNKLSRIIDSVSNSVNSEEQVYNYLRGKSTGIANPALAAGMATFRNLTTASRLGSAVLAAIADQAFIKRQADTWGLSYRNTLAKQITDLLTSSKSKENRLLATRLGMIIDWSHGIGSIGNRFADVTIAGKASSGAARLADITIRATGLAKLTRSGKSAFHLELNSHLTSFKGKSFSELPDYIQKNFSSHNITEADWNAIRSKTIEIDGVEWLDPQAMDQATSIKYLAMTNFEARLAVPEPGAEIRALMRGNDAAGTFGREVRSAYLQFGGFPLSVTLANWRRVMFHPTNQGLMNKFKYASSLALYSTMAGALYLNLKDLKDGKDFRDPTDPKFYVDALLAGGSFGLPYILGDKGQDPDKVKTISDYALGILPPALKMLGQATLIPANIGKRIEQGQPFKDVADFTIQNLPYDSWYTDFMKERYLNDTLRKMTYDKPGAAFRRQMKNLQRRTGQQYWWKPGKTTPHRGPKITDN